jgi:hypothetical protein
VIAVNALASPRKCLGGPPGTGGRPLNRIAIRLALAVLVGLAVVDRIAVDRSPDTWFALVAVIVLQTYLVLAPDAGRSRPSRTR